jgi:Zinc knuckle
MDKNCLKEEGQCFNCGNRGHMARDCPREKKPQTKNYMQPKKKPFDKSKTRKGPKKPTLVKPYWAGYQPCMRTASIEEVDSGDKEEEQGEGDIPSLATHTARLSENQHKDWLKEMDNIGIYF